MAGFYLVDCQMFGFTDVDFLLDEIQSLANRWCFFFSAILELKFRALADKGTFFLVNRLLRSGLSI